MTKKKHPFVIGVFDDRSLANRAIEELHRIGFKDDQVRFAGREAAKDLGSDLVSMGVPQGEIRFYQQELEAGHSIITVLAHGRKQEATDILSGTGAYNFDGRSARQQVINSEGDLKVPLREEQLQANKQEVEIGQVRLGKEVVSEQKTLDVPASHEEVYIERHPVSRQVADHPIGADENTSVPVYKEQVHTKKQPVVREEIGLGKRTIQETQQVSSPVQREEAQIERGYNLDVPSSGERDASDESER